MKKLGIVLALSLGASLTVACASPTDDGTGSSEEALTSLTAQGCKTPAIVTTPRKDGSGQPIAGSAHTTLKGCFVGANGESGADVLARVVTILGNTQSIGLVKNPAGAPVFQRFSPGPQTGSLQSTLSQDIDVTLAIALSPTTTLHVERRKLASGFYNATIVNSTPLKAKLGFIPITAVNTGDLRLDLQVRPETNGVTVSGTADVLLQQQQDQASNASLLVTDLFNWLGEQLAATAPHR